MRYIIGSFFLCWSLWSCNTPGEKATTLAFSMDSLMAESEAGCESDSVPCASFKARYPRFTGLPQIVQDSIAKALSVLPVNPENKVMSLAESADTFIKDWKEINEEFEGSSSPWSFESSAEVLILSDTLVSLKANSYQYTGGAHGMYETHYINVDPKTGSRITLDDVLRSGYLPTLTALGEKAFREARELTADESLADAGFDFPDGFQLNTNYGFSARGIEFTFVVYEVAPYALGSTEITIPYSQITTFIK